MTSPAEAGGAGAQPARYTGLPGPELAMEERKATELVGRPVLLRGRPVVHALLHLFGWRVVFDGLPARQGVIVVYPHTSNWDFLVAVLAKWAIGLPVAFWGKASLFELPLTGRWLRWLGGVPVLRHTPQGAVAHMVEAMRAARDQGRFLWLALAPEGTRARTAGWRTGFYRVAAGAGVPVSLVFLDFARRRVGFDSHWLPSGDLAADMALFAERLAPYRGCRPALAAPVRPLAPSASAPASASPASSGE